MKLSYAQNLEDYHLDLMFPGRSGTYVDVGGGHPVADNVSFWFYLKGWRGLVVEPQESLAKLYPGVRPRDRVSACLAGREDGIATFYQVEGLHGLSSMVPANAEQAKGFDAPVVPIQKPVRRLSALIDEAGLDVVDFLKIDVEGAEAEVLAGLDFARHRPGAIVMEALNPSNPDADSGAYEGILRQSGYEPALFDGLNRFFIHQSRPDLRSRLPEQATPWDKIAHLWDCGRAGEKPDHPDRKLAEILLAGLFAELPLLPPELLRRLIGRGSAALKIEGAEQIASLLGSAEYPGNEKPAPSLAGLLESDALRAALGRIACMYDGGHV